MKDTATPIINAQNSKQSMRDIENFIGLMRMALAPVLNADLDNLPSNQSKLVTAAAIFAGMSAGHMLAMGTLEEERGDRAQAKLVAMQAFDMGVEQGVAEFVRAMASVAGAPR